MGVLKFLHTSDLHIGKKLYGYSLSEDQKYILNEIVRIAKEQNVDGAIIAGDIYDVSAPSEESVSIFNEFVTDLADVCSVFIVPGNHDSAERIGYLKGLLKRSKVYVTGTYKGKAEKVVLEDDLGRLNMFLLPYMRTSFARNFYEDDSIRNPDMAMKVTLDHSEIDPSERNILVAHQFFAGIGVDLEQSESETSRISVGKDDCISTELLDAFDYGAFGHIHKPQKAGRETLQYCGSPLKYSESEVNDIKHVNIVEVRGKGDVSIEKIPLKPLNEMVCIEGRIDEVLSKAKALPKNTQVYVTLTERAERALERISAVCNLYHLEFRLSEGTGGYRNGGLKDIEHLSDMDLFKRFFKDMTGKELSEKQTEILGKVIEEVEGGQ